MSDNDNTATVILAAIIEMSDRAEKMGGATCISGVAALHRMQKSIQANRRRVIEMLKLQVKEPQP